MWKRILCAILVAAVLCVLCACGQSADAYKMYIEPARLTQEEEDIAELLGANLQQRIFDFYVDESIQRIDICAYELIDGEWNMFLGGGGRSFTDAQGRVALDFDRINEGLREAIQSENFSGSTDWRAETEEDPTGTSWATSLLTERKEIVYEEEIPLAIQIVTTQNEVRSFDTSYFFYPEEYEKYGYDHVYAITVKFSQIPLS